MTEQYWKAKLGSRFRVTIPKDALAAMGIKPPATVIFRTEEDGRVFISASSESETQEDQP